MKRFRQIFIPVVVVFLQLSLAMAYGAIWSTKMNLSKNTGDSWNSAIAVSGSNIYVVWHDYTPGNPEIYFKKSGDSGITWTASKRLTNNAGYSVYPAIAVNGLNIYVVWEDYTSGNYEIYFKKSSDGGITWTSDKRLTKNAGYSEIPAIAVDGSNIYVVWSDNTRRNYDIYFKKSYDGGNTWTKDKNLTNNAGDSFSPAIAVDSSNIYVVWDDYTPGNYEIYFKKSDDGGVTWTKNNRLTWNVGDSYIPAVAVYGLNIYVVWVDNTSGNYEIYFKQGYLD